MLQTLPSSLPVKLVGPVMFLMYMKSLIDVEVSPDTVSYTRDFDDYKHIVVVTFSREAEKKTIFPQTRSSSDKVIQVTYPYSINILVAMQDLLEVLHSLNDCEGDVIDYGWY